LYLRNRIVKEQLDRVTLAAELDGTTKGTTTPPSEGESEQDYVVMKGSGNDGDEDSDEYDKVESDSYRKMKEEKDDKKEGLMEMGVTA